MARLARKVMTHHLGQLALFDCFGTPLVSYPDRLSVVGDHPAARPSGESLASNDEDDSDALVTAPIVHRVISAQDAPPIAIKGPASIFDMGNLTKPITVRMERSQPQPAYRQVHRDAGVTRCVRIAEQDTAEWQERERARRARQRPPKPTAKAKTKSAKLVDLVGV